MPRMSGVTKNLDSPWVSNLAAVIFKSRSMIFKLLRKSLRDKIKVKIPLIFVFLGKFVRFFENSKNRIVQALEYSIIRDHAVE